MAWYEYFYLSSLLSPQVRVVLEEVPKWSGQHLGFGIFYGSPVLFFCIKSKNSNSIKIQRKIVQKPWLYFGVPMDSKTNERIYWTKWACSYRRYFEVLNYTGCLWNPIILKEYNHRSVESSENVDTDVFRYSITRDNTGNTKTLKQIWTGDAKDLEPQKLCDCLQMFHSLLDLESFFPLAQHIPIHVWTACSRKYCRSKGSQLMVNQVSLRSTICQISKHKPGT